MENYQRVLFPYAYNILGSAEDAKDAIQDVMSKYVTKSVAPILNEKNYLIKSVINQSIQMKNSKKRVVLEGEVWLPEPIATEQTDGGFELKEVAPYSLLTQLEQLGAKERAVFILKEGFGYSHEEVAAVLSTTTENSRKILSRAKDRLKKAKPFMGETRKQVASELVRKLMTAIQENDAKEVEQMLAADVQFFADGGSSINVVAKKCTGSVPVAQLITYVYHTYNHHLKQFFIDINHQPAVVYFKDDQVISCHVFEVAKGKFVRIDSILDPGKLTAISENVRV